MPNATEKLDEAVGIARALPEWREKAVYVVVGASGAWYARDGKRAFQFGPGAKGIPASLKAYCWNTRRQAEAFIQRLPRLRARIAHANAALAPNHTVAGLGPGRGRPDASITKPHRGRGGR